MQSDKSYLGSWVINKNMIGNIYTLTNKNGDSVSFNDHTDPLNVIALQEYPQFPVDVKNSEMDKEGQHGIWDFYSFYGKRLLTFTGKIIGEDEVSVEAQRFQLLKVVTLPPVPTTTDDGYLTLSWEDINGDEWQIDVKLQSSPNFRRNMRHVNDLDFQLILKAKDPQIESADLTEESGLRGWQQGSLLLEAELPALFDVIYNNTITTENLGTVPAHTIIRLYGEEGGITNPYIVNLTTNKLFKVNVTLADATEYIEIDSKTGTIVDQDGNDKSAFVDSSSEFILLNIGENEFVYLSDESWGAESPVNTWEFPTAEFSVSHRLTII